MGARAGGCRTPTQLTQAVSLTCSCRWQGSAGGEPDLYGSGRRHVDMPSIYGTNDSFLYDSRQGGAIDMYTTNPGAAVQVVMLRVCVCGAPECRCCVGCAWCLWVRSRVGGAGCASRLHACRLCRVTPAPSSSRLSQCPCHTAIL